MLSQLSYTPVFRVKIVELRVKIHSLFAVLHPFSAGLRNFIFSFPRLKVHNLSIAPSKLNNDTCRRTPIDLRIRSSIQASGLLRKEVIQPHLPIRLPCYDFTLITTPTFGRALLTVRLRTSGIDGSHGVTGGVYKARERIHRGMLIRDY